jgi:hypothetical protein
MAYWYHDWPELYLDDQTHLNIHICGVHMWRLVLRFGPLWSHSAFALESYYGSLVKKRSGTHKYQSQMLHIVEFTRLLFHSIYKWNYNNTSVSGQLLLDLNYQKFVT